ncbi:uncharacterized protein CIMG_07724 [Coccidioides immitis RS]|uniref:Uncharacterized protein n=4 Tax=Coccidioides immitis TaxID=5501 RepID=A0A0E1RVL1_COCIM|nr:uncharacterized protein CIMG_07724 [Coccidioides immitis RS]EAS28978.2 hypothetical protein CIMG_07724 [Coccidioides immitis RS]KMP06103.1 hypothetical protein CIRG_05784 [Coccidioides immitis RMSCC 2394]KMU79196.1 hypothetical protein CISG_07559 [Coccidioides immitis RMSCC 3703]KMU87782.1 hypothetical protein CIHG_05551 [Coccidioides immitis H538.4]
MRWEIRSSIIQWPSYPFPSAFPVSIHIRRTDCFSRSYGDKVPRMHVGSCPSIHRHAYLASLAVVSCTGHGQTWCAVGLPIRTLILISRRDSQLPSLK